MAKPYKIPDFRKMYPEASEEVIAVLRTTERKMQYQEYDLKRARNIVDPKTGEVMTVPSREDSYERLQEMAVQFPEEDDGRVFSRRDQNTALRESNGTVSIHGNTKPALLCRADGRNPVQRWKTGTI